MSTTPNDKQDGDPAVGSTVLLGECSHDKTLVAHEVDEEGRDSVVWMECAYCGKVLLP